MQMHLYVLLLLSVAYWPASSMPWPRLVEVDQDIDIPEINEGLHLLEGDIMKTRKKRSIRGTNYTWDLPVPYEFGLTLDMNAKGVILRAFEQFRLKTCVDFKPHSSEDYYIYLLKMKGCWSSVGKQYTKEQFISIGHNCDNTAVVEHEFLHALGFWHEQSRYDRDEYVTITWENIEAGEEKNFEIKTNTTNSTLGTPYDYNSVLHYDKNAFSNGNGSTIITNQPEFQEVIGQRRDMSHLDVLELNHLYGCNESISFLDHCSFDKDLCQMSLCSGNSEGWKRVIRADGGPNSDHTYLGKKPQGRSLFMHFSTLTGKVGDSARLETRKITPKRSCHTQCLQFFYYHSGGRTDQLNIWIREFSNDSDYIGTIRLMDQIKGLPTNYWKVHHVPLDARKTFQVVFEAQKGTTSSRGGFSVDDINLTETDCPHETWQIRNFEEVLNNSPNDTYLYSPKYYSPDGYRYQIILRLSVDHFGIFVRLVSGFNDASLQWPCPWRQVTISLLDQNAHIQQQMTKQRSVTTDPHWLLSGYYGRPTTYGTLEREMYSYFYANEGRGYGSFMMSTELREREFLKGGDIFLLITMQDISDLLFRNELRCPRWPGKKITVRPPAPSDGPCAAQPPSNHTTRSTSTTTMVVERTTPHWRSESTATVVVERTTPHWRSDIPGTGSEKSYSVMLVLLFTLMTLMFYGCKYCCDIKRK